MNRFAYILAAEEYADIRFQKTWYCHNDATLVRDTLTQCLDYKPENITSRLLSLNDGFTPEKLQEELQLLLDGSAPEDTILFYFAGHGVLHAGTAFLVLPDTKRDDYRASALSLDAIDSLLRRDERLCVRVFDACHSGTEPMKSQDAAQNDTRGFLGSLQNSPKGWVTLASCNQEEKSFWDDTLKHGIFTYSLCNAIKEAGHGTLISPFTLHDEIVTRVKKWATDNKTTQTPTIHCYLPGRQIIGVRQVISKAKVKREVPSKRSLQSRLEQVRKFKEPTAENFELIKLKSRQWMECYLPNFPSLGSIATLLKPEELSSASSEIRDSIVRDIESKQLHPPFPCYSKTENTELLRYSITSMINPGRMSKTYTFYPEGYQTFLLKLVIDARSPLPQASMFLAALPLRSSIYLLTGTIIDHDSAIGEGKTGLKLHYYAKISTSELERWEPDSILSKTSKELEKRYHEAADDIVSYMEREAKD